MNTALSTYYWLHCSCVSLFRDHRKTAPPTSAGTNVFNGLLRFIGYHVGRYLRDPRLREPLRSVRLPRPVVQQHPLLHLAPNRSPLLLVACKNNRFCLISFPLQEVGHRQLFPQLRAEKRPSILLLNQEKEQPERCYPGSARRPHHRPLSSPLHQPKHTQNSPAAPRTCSRSNTALPSHLGDEIVSRP